ncbi:MAG TPA: lysophospholipid acyltransferase family protein [Candidatus Acidoferrales bacterium]|nr:lysophospholipid acyltransferase family protein [Candidatus Acidoferrales bacterium]
MIRTIFVAVSLPLFILLVGPPLLLYTWISNDPEAIYRIGLGGCYWVSRAVGMRQRVEGAEKIPPRTVFFMANHSSFVDAVPVVHAIPRRVAILAKKSLFELPIVGWAFKMAGFVPVDRSNRESAIASVEFAAARLKSGVSFLAYPEGTRSYDGRLLAFKKGIFVMAIAAGATIVPMVAIGVHRIMPKKSLTIRPGEVVVRFGEPIESSGYTVDDREALAARVRAAMIALLPPDQQPLDSRVSDVEESPKMSA